MFQRGLNRVTEAHSAGRSAIGAFIGGLSALYSTYPASRSIWRIYMGCAWVGADCGVCCHAPGGPWASHDGRRLGSWWTMAETRSTTTMDCGGKRGSAMRLMNNSLFIFLDINHDCDPSAKQRARPRPRPVSTRADKQSSLLPCCARPSPSLSVRASLSRRAKQPSILLAAHQSRLSTAFRVHRHHTYRVRRE